MKISVSKLNTAETCLRHWWFQYVLGIVPEISPARKAAREEGERVHAIVESYMLGEAETVSGAAAEVIARYPIPGQRGVELEKWVRCPWAGAKLIGRVDLLCWPGVEWGPLARQQKKNLSRVTDLKVVRSLHWAKTAEQLDHDRQLLAYAAAVYREKKKDIPNLIEISQVTVEREAPFWCQSVVRIVSRDQILDRENQDCSLVERMRTVLSADVDEFKDIDGPRDRSSCTRWYGAPCPYREICTGTIPLPSVDRDNAGEGEKTMGVISPPDAATPAEGEVRFFEGETKIRHTVFAGQPYTAVQGRRHGKIWELRALGDAWKLVIGDRLQDNSVEGFQHVVPTETIMSGDAPGCGNFDIDRLRKEILHPVLNRWDATILPPEEKKPEKKPEETPADDADADAIFGEAEKTTEAQTSDTTLDESKVAELVSAGATDRQARVMVEAGYTLAQIRSGQVTAVDLERLKSFGKKTAATVLERLCPETGSSPTSAEETIPEENPSPTSAEETIPESPEIPESTSEKHESVEPAKADISEESDPKLGGFHIYIGCRPIVGSDAKAVHELSTVLRPYLDAVAADRRVVDVSLLKAYEWPGMVSECLHKAPPESCVIAVPQGDPLWDKFSRFFLDRATLVVVRYG